MKVSLNWAQNVSNVDLKSVSTDELLLKIGSQLGAVESVELWGPKYEGVVVAKVVTCDPHPNADKLHVCKIDDGGVTPSIERDDNNLVQVVCGAPNVTAGMVVAWIPPGSTVPSTFNKEPFVLGARELRGVMSNGMLASPAELAISDNHDGILEILSSEVGEELAVPGTDFSKLYDLDDVVIDCENKMFTHRPDCFGILGVARELAGINHQKFVSPNWYKETPVFKNANDLSLHTTVESGLVPRFMSVAIDNVSVKPSPIHMQAALSRVGIRPINNIVDITNWLMHLTGQPLHAYDYDKVRSLCEGVPTLIARQAKSDETVALLNGKTITLDESAIVIATDKQVVGIAGVMGGADTEVDQNTKSIILEVASFDMYSIRRTAMKYGLFTDAVTRFNKGQSPLQNDRVIMQAIKMVHDLAGGTQGSKVIDVKAASVQSLPTVSAKIDFINTRLGCNLTVAEAAKLLENVECVEHVGIAQETRSYLMGVGDITDKLQRIGVKIVEKTPEGNYKLIIPEGTETEYEKIVAWELKPGFWNEMVGAKNVFLFKDLDTKVTRYEVSDDTEREIVEMCRNIANEYFTSLDGMLANNSWYKPLLPLKKTFQSEATDFNSVIVSPPFWRRDLECAEDLVEEIGRLYGFDKLPVTLPKRTSRPVVKDSHLQLLQTIRQSLTTAGANEVLTYSFVHQNLLKNVGQSQDLAFHIRNAISPDLQYYRMSLVPSLLDKVHMNIKAGYDNFALYEFGRVHNKVKEVAKDDVPEEYNLLGFILAANDKIKSGPAYYDAKLYLDFIAQKLGVSFDYEPIESMPDFPLTKPYEPSRSAFIMIKGTKTMLGVIGEFKNSVIKSLKLPKYTAGFEIGTNELLEYTSSHSKVNTYKQLQKFPSSSQDITLEVTANLHHSKLLHNIESTLDVLSKEHGYITQNKNGDIFTPAESDKKRITFHVTLAHPDRTLLTEEVSRSIDEISRRAVAEFAAIRI